MDTSRTSWIARAEAAIRTLRDVDSASIQSDGEVIREIHVLCRSNRPPKQIVRDIQTLLLTRFDRTIDYRVVSVAYLGDEAPARPREPGPRVVLEPPVSSPPETRALPASAAPRTAAEPVPAAGPVTAERIRFASVNLFSSGHRTQAQVELRWRGLPRMGSASGLGTRAGAHRLIAQATLAAVQEFLADEVALTVQDVDFFRLGRRRAAVVSLSLLAGRQEKLLIGTCPVEQDSQQAVVFATLAGLNRVVAGLRPKEPTEYILRPTPAQ